MVFAKRRYICMHVLCVVVVLFLFIALCFCCCLRNVAVWLAAMHLFAGSVTHRAAMVIHSFEMVIEAYSQHKSPMKFYKHKNTCKTPEPIVKENVVQKRRYGFTLAPQWIDCVCKLIAIKKKTKQKAKNTQKKNNAQTTATTTNKSINGYIYIGSLNSHKKATTTT